MKLRTTLEGMSLRLLAGAPAPVKRALGGRPIVLDGQTLAPDLQLLLRAQGLLRGEETDVPIAKLRADMKADAAVAGGRQVIGAVRETTVAGRPARHYLPSAPLAPVDAPGPLLIFLHGGGFIEGDVDTHDAPCRLLAELSGVPVLSVEYRLAPEETLPAAHDDAYAAFLEIRERAAELGVDPERIAVGGDSAGGNLAAWIAIRAAREGVTVAFQLLIYPLADGEHRGESMRMFAQGFYLTRDFIDRAERSYLPEPGQPLDERISLVRAELPAGLAPTYLVTAGFDPLRDEGERYARLLGAAGHEVELQRFPDQVHGFINMLVLPSSRDAAATVARRLRAAMGQPA